MKTLQIGDEWLEEKEGGLARYFYDLLRSLPQTGTLVKGLVVGTERVSALTDGQVRAFERADAPLWRRWQAARGAALQMIREDRIDLISAHFALYAFPILDKLGPPPMVVHFHGPWGGESGAEGAGGLATRFKVAVERAVYSRASRFIVLSHAFQGELVRRYKVPEERIRVIPGGVDIARFHVGLTRAEARQRLAWPADRPILLSIRRQVRRMGLENLIDAMRMLKAAYPDILLLLGGTGPLAEELQGRIREYGMERHIKLLGRVPQVDLPLAYRAADMTVVPTQALEGFGLVTLESMAAGTPVYVTPVGGLPEALEPFAPQCVFPGISAKDMAGTLAEALRGSVSRPSDEACRSYANENFSWERIAARVREVYDEAVA